MLTKTLRFDDEVKDVFQNMVWSEDGLIGEITAQLAPNLYKKAKKAIEAVGSSWDKRAKVHRFGEDPRVQLFGLVKNGILTVERDGFFQTPAAVVQTLLSLVPIPNTDPNILEPEAGEGAMVAELIQAHPNYDPARMYCIEKNPKRCQKLRERFPGIRVACGDFLRFRNSDNISFTRIYMNPPFEEGQDAEHVRKAWNVLALGGGIMAAIMGEGVFFRDDRRSDNFRAWLKAVDAYSEKLPEKSFHTSGTDVNTRLLIVEK